MTNRIVKNIFALSVVQVLNYAVPLFVLLYLTKILGMELYGVLAFSQGMIALACILVDFGYGLSATEKISKYRERKIYISKLILGVSIVKFGLILLVALGIASYALLTTKYESYRIIFLLSLLPIVGQSLTPTWFFQGIEKMKFIAIFTVFSKAVFLVTIFLVIKNPSDYFWVPVLNGLSQIGALMISIYFIFRSGYRTNRISLKFLIYCVKFTKGFFLSRVAVASYMSSATVVLGFISEPVVVAIYAVAEQLYKAMQSAVSTVSIATYPYMSKERNVQLMFWIVGISVLAVTVGATIGYLVGPTLISLVFGDEWLRSLPVINIFLLAIVVHGGAVMMGYPLAAAVGKVQVANKTVIGGAIVYVGLLVLMLLLDQVTPFSMAAIMVVSESCILACRTYLLLPVAIKDLSSRRNSSI